MVVLECRGFYIVTEGLSFLMGSDDSYKVNRRLLQSSKGTEITVPIQLSNGVEMPRVSEGDVVLLLPEEGVEEPVDVIARVLEPLEQGFTASAVEYIRYLNPRTRGVNELEPFTGVRRLSPFRARKILVNGEAFDTLLHNPSTLPYVALIRYAS